MILGSLAEFAGLFYILTSEENGLRRQSELKARVSSGEGSEKSGQLFTMFCGKVLSLDSTLLVTGGGLGKGRPCSITSHRWRQ